MTSCPLIKSNPYGQEISPESGCPQDYTFADKCSARRRTPNQREPHKKTPIDDIKKLGLVGKGSTISRS